MKRRNLIVAGGLALALAVLVLVPTWLTAAEPVPDEATVAERPARGFLGVGLRELTPELQLHFGAPEGSGVLVASVGEDSPASTAGLLVGDVVTAVDGLPVDSARGLSREIRHRPGASVVIELYRDGSRREVTAILGERETRGWGHPGGRSPAEWDELAEQWEAWGEEFGETMGRWGEEFGRRWGDEHAEEWRRWAEEMAGRGEDWEEMGEEIGRSIEQALGEVDWDEIGKAVEQSLKSLEGIDWEGMGEQIERQMQELERQIEERAEPRGRTD